MLYLTCSHVTYAEGFQHVIYDLTFTPSPAQQPSHSNKQQLPSNRWSHAPEGVVPSACQTNIRRITNIIHHINVPQLQRKVSNALNRLLDIYHQEYDDTFPKNTTAFKARAFPKMTFHYLLILISLSYRIHYHTLNWLKKRTENWQPIPIRFLAIKHLTSVEPESEDICSTFDAPPGTPMSQ